MFFHPAFIAFLILVLVKAEEIHVEVGKGGALKFVPEVFTALAGDIVSFHFFTGSGPHSVNDGPFESPCTYGNKSLFYSGKIDGDANGFSTYQFQVPNQDPIWLYCGVRQHCQHGMVGVINPPSDKGLSQYRATAATVANATVPTGNSTTTPGNGTSTSTGSSTTTNKPAGPASSSAAPSSTSSGATAYTVTPEAGSVFVGLMSLIGAAFI